MKASLGLIFRPYETNTAEISLAKSVIYIQHLNDEVVATIRRFRDSFASNHARWAPPVSDTDTGVGGATQRRCRRQLRRMVEAEELLGFGFLGVLGALMVTGVRGKAVGGGGLAGSRVY